MNNEEHCRFVVKTIGGLTLKFYNSDTVKNHYNGNMDGDNPQDFYIERDAKHCVSCDGTEFEITGDSDPEYFILCEQCGTLQCIPTEESDPNPFVDDLKEYLESKYGVIAQ